MTQNLPNSGDCDLKGTAHYAKALLAKHARGAYQISLRAARFPLNFLNHVAVLAIRWPQSSGAVKLESD